MWCEPGGRLGPALPCRDTKVYIQGSGKPGLEAEEGHSQLSLLKLPLWLWCVQFGGTQERLLWLCGGSVEAWMDSR